MQIFISIHVLRLSIGIFLKINVINQCVLQCFFQKYLLVESHFGNWLTVAEKLHHGQMCSRRKTSALSFCGFVYEYDFSNLSPNNEARKQWSCTCQVPSTTSWEIVNSIMQSTFRPPGCIWQGKGRGEQERKQTQWTQYGTYSELF